jgi:transposase InsO family protein
LRAPPSNKLTELERQLIVDTSNRAPYSSLPPSQVVPRLADEGCYIASESSFYRVLRAAGQLKHRGKAKAPGKRHKPQAFKATGPNQVWTWDITFIASTVIGWFYRLYMVSDVYSRKIVGWEIHENESSEHAARLIRKACLAENVEREQLVLHSDNGAPMKGATMLATLQNLGVMPSFSRPAVSNDNPFAESLFRTLKYRPGYPSKPFDSVESAQTWVMQFVAWYNTAHRHSALNFVTPQQRHTGADVAILANRKAVYEQAKVNRPQRWSGETRNCQPIGPVWLNRDNETEPSSTEIRAQAA